MNKSYSMTLPPKAARQSKPRGRSWFAGRPGAPRRRLLSEQLEARALLAADLMHNVDLPSDVNHDGSTTPLDALFIINELNAGGSRSLMTGAAPQISGLFYDVNNDLYLTPVDALLVLNDLNAEGEDGDLVQIRLETTDLGGTPINAIDLGGDFQLRAYVQDLTGRENGGVFAAYVDVVYPSAQVSIADGTGIVHGEDYGSARSGSLAQPGLIDEAGSIDGLDVLGPAEFLLFTVTMTADAPGEVNFVPDPADLSPAHDVLVYGVPDGETSSIVAPDRISFLPATLQIEGGEAPVAVDDAYEVPQDQVLIVGADLGVLANDTNPGTGTLTASLVDSPANGSLNLTANGAFSYTPVTGFSGLDSFTYTATLDGVTSNVATVTIDVLAANDPPVAVDDSFSVDEDMVLNGVTSNVLSNDTDPNGDSLAAVLVTGPSDGVLELNPNGTFSYTPAENFNGTDSFTYVANDGQAESEPATVTITVNAVNDAPVALDDDYSIGVDGNLVVDANGGVLANDLDVENDPLTALLLTGTSNGDLDFNEDGSFTYTPNPGFTGSDSFTYEANDGTDNSNVATVTINVTGETQVAFRFETTNLAGTSISSIGPGGEFLLRAYVQDVSDIPRDGVFAAYLDVLYEATLVSINGNITYGDSYPNQQSGDTSVPGLIDEVGAFDGLNPLGPSERLLFSVPMIANAAGIAEFTSNGPDLLPAHDILLFNVNTPVLADQVQFASTQLSIIAGDPPVAVDDAYETDEDVVLSVDAENGVLANDSDPEDDALTAVLVTGPAHGILVLNADGSFTYTPNANFNGDDSFTYRASDGAQTSNLATVALDVKAVSDLPIAIDDAYRVQTMGSFVVDAANGVLANDIDVDGNSLVAVFEGGATNGELVLNADGSFTYTPDEGFVGRDTFTYRAVANELESNLATVTIDVGDLAPSSIVGFVYADTDNDGVLDPVEARYGGVEITLRGTDLLGRSVSLRTETAADGSYRFDDVLSGSYTVTEFQPLFLIDGKDTINGVLSLRNDRFLIDLQAGVVAGDYNFGERGLRPEFIRNPMFFSSRVDHGMLAGFNSAGQMLWYCADKGWESFTTIDGELLLARNSVQIDVVDAIGRSDSDIIALLGSSGAELMGDGAEGYLLRMVGAPEDYGIDPSFFGEGELEASAVDAAFGGVDA